jgi:hypothetical protein
LWLKRGASLLACQDSTLSIYYDSLIEKCSTVSGSERQRDPQCLLLFKLSVGAERASGHALYQ